MDFPDGICVPSGSTNSEIPLAPNRGRRDHPGSNSLLVEKTLVHTLDPAISLQPLSPPKNTQPTYPGGDYGFEGLETEQRRLEELGCSHKVIQTLLQDRK